MIRKFSTILILHVKRKARNVELMKGNETQNKSTYT